MDTSELKVYLKTALQQMIDNAGSFNGESGFTMILDNSNTEQAQYQDAPLFSGQTLAIKPPCDDMRGLQNAKQHVPEQIRRMKNLYQYRSGSFRQICKNFYVQGKFMEDYEDNAPWDGVVSTCYWPTYHNLSLAQLRGYFTWRTELRKGNYQKHCETFVSMYLYELLNGIGTKSVEDSLHKMEEFEKGYIDAGFSDRYLRGRLHRWMLELAVLNGLAPDIACKYADSDMLEKDAAVEILRYPEKFSAQEVFNALCVFGGKKTAESKLVQEHGTEAINFFAAVWCLASAQYRKDGEPLFCFGIPSAREWSPLESTFYYDNYSNSKKRKAITYKLNPSRTYLFKRDKWYEVAHQNYDIDRKRIVNLLQETDRRLRLYLKTGHPLKERKEAAWAVPYIEAVIEADRKAKLEAARPKISIDFSGLDKIRKDALETQDSLLTEEETQCTPETASKPSEVSVPLDGMQIQLLRMLLRGEPVLELIAAQRRMPSVIADAINEALFDLIGDTVVECDGKTIILVEDYRDNIIGILG